MTESVLATRADPRWDADTVRDRALSNAELAREIADLARDGRGIEGTVLGLLNRIRPERAAPGDGETPIEDLVARALCTARGQDPDEILFHQDGDPPEPSGPRWSLELPAARAAIAVMNPGRRLDLEALRTAIARTIVEPREALPAHCSYSLETLQAIHWDQVDAGERGLAKTAASAIVDRHILPLLDLRPSMPSDQA